MNHSRKRRRIMANAKGIPKGLDKRLRRWKERTQRKNKWKGITKKRQQAVTKDLTSSTSSNIPLYPYMSPSENIIH